MISIVGETTRAPLSQRSRDAFMLVRADAQQLAEIAKMIDAGQLRVFVEAVYPLEEAGLRMRAPNAAKCKARSR